MHTTTKESVLVVSSLNKSNDNNEDVECPFDHDYAGLTVCLVNNLKRDVESVLLKNPKPTEVTDKLLSHPFSAESLWSMVESFFAKPELEELFRCMTLCTRNQCHF